MNGDSEIFGDENSSAKSRKAYESVIKSWAKDNKPAAAK